MKIGRKYKITAAILLFVALSLVFFALIKPKPATPQTNVILIVVDALRPDHLGCYGYKRNTSPNIDQFAKEGVLFTQAISQGPHTPSSLFSVLTSTYPYTHKVYAFGTPLNNKIKTLPEILRNKGFYLALINGRGGMSEFHFPKFEKEFNYFYPATKKYILANKVTENAIQWIRANSKKRFFLWLYYIDTHAPYTKPCPYKNLYLNDKFTKEENKRIPIADDSKEPYYGYGVIPRITSVKDKTDTGYYIALYDGEIRFVDEQIGKVLTELKRINLYDNTLIVIISDHGENMGEHNYYFSHGDNLYDQLLKVPLIILGSNVIPHGRKIDYQVRLIDIAPTILEILGIERPKKIQGISLLPVILNKTNDLHTFAFSETEGKTSVRTDKWKFIQTRDIISGAYSYELYDLENDSKELRNLTLQRPTEVNSFREKLKEYTSSCEKVRMSILGKELTDKPVALDEETKEKLRSLGYIK